MPYTVSVGITTRPPPRSASAAAASADSLRSGRSGSTGVIRLTNPRRPVRGRRGAGARRPRGRGRSDPAEGHTHEAGVRRRAPTSAPWSAPISITSHPPGRSHSVARPRRARVDVGAAHQRLGRVGRTSIGRSSYSASLRYGGLLTIRSTRPRSVASSASRRSPWRTSPARPAGEGVLRGERDRARASRRWPTRRASARGRDGQGDGARAGPHVDDHRRRTVLDGVQRRPSRRSRSPAAERTRPGRPRRQAEERLLAGEVLERHPGAALAERPAEQPCAVAVSRPSRRAYSPARSVPSRCISSVSTFAVGLSTP